MPEQTKGGLERVRDALSQLGAHTEVIELPASTRSAADAAKAIGCEVAQIAKSIIFRAKNSNRPVLVIASGANRIDEAQIARIIGEPIEKANAEFVRERTGFAIGGVAPVGHMEKLEILIDGDLAKHAQIWAAAGTPHTVFPVTFQQLVEWTGGRAYQ